MTSTIMVGLQEVYSRHLMTEAYTAERRWKQFKMLGKERKKIGRNKVYEHVQKKGVISRNFPVLH